jgi:hypothetical protein
MAMWRSRAPARSAPRCASAILTAAGLLRAQAGELAELAEKKRAEAAQRNDYAERCEASPPPAKTTRARGGRHASH